MTSTNAKDRKTWDGISTDLTTDFIARQPDMIETYRNRLILERSPFGIDLKHWFHTSRYAMEVFAECVFSIRHGRLSATGGAVLDLRPDCTTPEERDQAAVQCIQAARTLFGVIAEVLCQVFPDRGDSFYAWPRSSPICTPPSTGAWKSPPSSSRAPGRTSAKCHVKFTTASATTPASHCASWNSWKSC